MKRIKELVVTAFCVLLYVLGYVANQNAYTAGPAETTAQTVEQAAGYDHTSRDDDCRTTYEIFVSSFCDSDGDRIGDLNGIRGKLDYISDLGFDQIWLTPVHPSDTYHKYDVDDYLAIDPTFGTMGDYEALLEECHARGIRVLMDLVLNHTSDTHPWFQAAVDYLRTLPDGQEPVFEDCPYVWYYTFSREPYQGFVPLEGTQWYYEARFWSEMPDLNLGNEVVRREIRDIVRYWLDKGVDGFRLDAVTSYVTDSPEGNIEFMRFLEDTCRGIDPDCYLVGEAWTDDSSIARLYASGIDSLFDFPFAGPNGVIGSVMKGSSAASEYVQAMVRTEAAYDEANPSHVGAPFYTNHDMDRSASYYPSDTGAVTKMTYAMSLLMPGDSFVYYGEEIGMGGSGRDENRRAPMYWSEDAAATGMCAAPSGMEEVPMRFASLEGQMTDDGSLWSWFKEVIRVRKAFPAIAQGKTEAEGSLCDEGVAAFIRRHEGDDDVLVVMNLRNQPATKDLSSVSDGLRLAAALSTGGEDVTLEQDRLSLPAYSIAVLTFGADSL